DCSQAIAFVGFYASRRINQSCPKTRGVATFGLQYPQTAIRYHADMSAHSPAPPRNSAIDPTSGLIRGARYVRSPNFDERPPGVQPDLIVIHSISLPPDEYGGPWIDHLFTNTLPADA